MIRRPVIQGCDRVAATMDPLSAALAEIEANGNKSEIKDEENAPQDDQSPKVLDIT